MGECEDLTKVRCDGRRMRRPIMLFGVKYPSMRQAVLDGIVSSDYQALEFCNDPGFPDCRFLTAEEAPPPMPKKNRQWRRVWVDGVEYECASAAAEAHGLSRNGVNWRCASPGFPNWTTEGKFR